MGYNNIWRNMISKLKCGANKSKDKSKNSIDIMKNTVYDILNG